MLEERICGLVLERRLVNSLADSLAKQDRQQRAASCTQAITQEGLSSKSILMGRKRHGKRTRSFASMSWTMFPVSLLLPGNIVQDVYS